MWQGVMRAWSTIQSGLEQQDPETWAEIMRHPLFGNRMLTNELGVQWGTDSKTTMSWWPSRNLKSLQNIIRQDGEGWKIFEEQSLRRTKVTPNLYARLRNSIPWEALPTPDPKIGQWVAPKEDNGDIRRIFHISNINPLLATLYHTNQTESLTCVERQHHIMAEQMQEVRVVQCGETKNTVLGFNPREEPDSENTLWRWGNSWIRDLEWDPKEWVWRRIGVLANTSILNYTTKRGYRVALRQNNQVMKVDAELESAGYNSKARAKFFNRIWHPYLPRKISAMQWLILTEGLPVGAWRAKIGLPGACQLCAEQSHETLQHAFQECPEISRVWTLFRDTRRSAGLSEAYTTWLEISRGLMTNSPGPSVEEELRWDMAVAYKITIDTPWDLLRAHLLWAIWCQKVDLAFRNEEFHLGLVLWNAWRNTIYYAMEAYKELFRHKRNEEKRQEIIECFQTIWTSGSIFGRLRGDTIRWNLTPHPLFLPREVGAWLTPPIRTNRLSQSPDPEAQFMANPDLSEQIDDFVQGIANQWQPNRAVSPQAPQTNSDQEFSPIRSTPFNDEVDRMSTGDALHFPPSQTQCIGNIQEEGVTEGPTIPQACRPPIKSRNKMKCIRRKKDGLTQPDTRFQAPTRISHAACWDASPSHLPEDLYPELDEDRHPSSSFPVRVTLRQPSTSVNSVRFAHQKLGVSAAAFEERVKEDVEAFFKGVGAAKVPPKELPSPPPPTTETTNSSKEGGVSLPKPKSRHKVCCRFGPARPREARPLFQLQTQNKQPHTTSWDASSLQLPEDLCPELEEEDRSSYSFPARCTLMHSVSPKRTPFDHYLKKPAQPAPALNPYRFAHRKLGMSEAAFEECLKEDVEAFFKEIEEDKASSEAPNPPPPPDTSSSSSTQTSLHDATPVEKVLSKDECFRRLMGSELNTGSLLGMYLWAADLGRARYWNFEMKWDKESIELLNAYDCD